MPKNIDTIGRKFGANLTKVGQNIITQSFNLHPFTRTQADLIGYFRQKNLSVSLFDRAYKIIPLHEWQEIVKYVNITEEKWIEDYFDCDNKSYYYASLMSLLFKLNSCGVARVPGHLFNLLLSGSPQELKLYVYDPRGLEIKEYNPSGTIIDGFDYTKISWAYYF